MMPTERVVRELELPSGATVSVDMPTYLCDEDREAMADAMVSLGCEVHPDGVEWDELPTYNDLDCWESWTQATDPVPGCGPEVEAAIFERYLSEDKRVVLAIPRRDVGWQEWLIVFFLVKTAIKMAWARILGNPVSEIEEEDGLLSPCAPGHSVQYVPYAHPRRHSQADHTRNGWYRLRDHRPHVGPAVSRGPIRRNARICLRVMVCHRHRGGLGD